MFTWEKQFTHFNLLLPSQWHKIDKESMSFITLLQAKYLTLQNSYSINGPQPAKIFKKYIF